MCHLAIEKALKGLYKEKLGEIPPKTHNLVYLVNKIGVQVPEHIGRTLTKLNSASVATRYPEEIEQLQKNYTSPVVQSILAKNRVVLEWIQTQF